MRALETIHLNELGGPQGVASNLTWSYAAWLAKAAANKYARNFGVFELTKARETSLTRYSVSALWQGEARPMVEVFKPDPREGKPPPPFAGRLAFPIYTDEMPPPDISAEEIHVEPVATTVKPGPAFKPGDTINYPQGGDDSIWNGSVVQRVVKNPPFAGQYHVTAPGGAKGIIPGWSMVLAPTPPVSRSTTHKTVGCYKLKLSTSQSDGVQRYQRLALRSIPRDLTEELELEYLDSLIQTQAVENDLDVAELFTMQNAPKFEEELEEGRLIV